MREGQLLFLAAFADDMKRTVAPAIQIEDVLNPGTNDPLDSPTRESEAAHSLPGTSWPNQPLATPPLRPRCRRRPGGMICLSVRRNRKALVQHCRIRELRFSAG